MWWMGDGNNFFKDQNKWLLRNPKQRKSLCSTLVTNLKTYVWFVRTLLSYRPLPIIWGTYTKDISLKLFIQLCELKWFGKKGFYENLERKWILLMFFKKWLIKIPYKEFSNKKKINQLFLSYPPCRIDFLP